MWRRRRLQIKEGKSEAYGKLFRKYYQQIYSVCLSILENPHDAEEVVQETFVHAYLKLNQLKKPEKFSAWLKKIAKNRSKNYLRDNREYTISISLASAQTVDSGVEPDERLLKKELIDAIMEAVSALPPKDREIVKARIEGLNHSEISERFNVSVDASMSRLYRARKEIKARVKELLNAIIGLPNTLSLKKIISGGITAMKIGTSTKVTIGVIGAIVAGFTGFQVVTYNKTQPKVKPTEKVTQKTVRPKPQPKPVRKHLDESEKIIQDEQYPTEKEIEEALAWLDSIGSGEKTEDIQEVAPETEVTETEDSESTISPELEEKFRIYKEYVDKMRALVRKQASLQGRWEKLNNRADEIADMHIVSKEEREELQQVLKELERLNTILDPIREDRAQIKNEYNEYFQTHYGMSLRQFHKTYFDAFRVWEKNQ